MDTEQNNFINTLSDLLHGGFAPNIDLLREFDPDKAGILLNRLHFSAYSLLLHMQHRQKILLKFMQHPDKETDAWPEAFWPTKYEPDDINEWEQAISRFETDMNAMIAIIRDPETDLLKIHYNGKSIYWAAATCLHHNAYHIGQLKAVGRQLGMWQ